MKRVSHGEEAIVRIPVILEPIQVEVPLETIPVQVRNVTVAIRVLPNRANVQSII